MTRLIEFQLSQADSSTLVVVEVDEPLGSGEELVSGTIDRASQSFRDALKQIRPAASAIVEQVQGLGPNEASIEFGVKLSAKAGAVLAAGSLDANYKVTLSWRAEE
jgi:hypothetical protein